jgi:hypothetical protein
MTDIIVVPNDLIEVVKTKEEIAKQKKKDYMREYMKEYHKKRYNTDEEYRNYRIEMTKKSSNKMIDKYVKAYKYCKDNNISI